MDFLDKFILGPNTPKYADGAMFPSKTFRKYMCQKKHCTNSCFTKNSMDYEYLSNLLSEKDANMTELRQKITSIPNEFSFSIWYKYSGCRTMNIEYKQYTSVEKSQIPSKIILEEGNTDLNKHSSQDLVSIEAQDDKNGEENTNSDAFIISLILNMKKEGDSLNQEDIFNVYKNIVYYFNQFEKSEVLIKLIKIILNMPHSTAEKTFRLIYAFFKKYKIYDALVEVNEENVFYITEEELEKHSQKNTQEQAVTPKEDFIKTESNENNNKNSEEINDYMTEKNNEFENDKKKAKENIDSNKICENNNDITSSAETINKSGNVNNENKISNETNKNSEGQSKVDANRNDQRKIKADTMKETANIKPQIKHKDIYNFWKMVIFEKENFLIAMINYIICYENLDFINMVVYIRDNSKSDDVSLWIKQLENLSELIKTYESFQKAINIQEKEKKEFSNTNTSYFDLLIIQSELIKTQEAVKAELNEKMEKIKKERDDLYLQKKNLVEATENLENELREYQEKYANELKEMLRKADAECEEFKKENLKLKETLDTMKQQND